MGKCESVGVGLTVKSADDFIKIRIDSRGGKYLGPALMLLLVLARWVPNDGGCGSGSVVGYKCSLAWNGVNQISERIVWC